MALNLGEIGNAIEKATANQQIGAETISWGAPVNFDDIVIGDVINSQINRDVSFGDPNIFLWGHTKWGSKTKKVGA